MFDPSQVIAESYLMVLFFRKSGENMSRLRGRSKEYLCQAPAQHGHSDISENDTRPKIFALTENSGRHVFG